MSGILTVRSGVGYRSGEGFVTLHWGDEAGQLSPDEARQHGLRLIECATAAEDDAAMVKALKGLGLEEMACFTFLAEMREARGHRQYSGDASLDIEPLSGEEFPGGNGGPLEP